MTPEQFIDLLEKLIGKQLQKKMFHLGKIASIDGDRASVYIDGSTIPTPNVPYNPNIKFNAGEEVWVVYINFDPNDKFILCKRGTETPDPPSSGGDMQVHGNEWHTIAFETVAGAQEKVDTHADSKSTHGVGSNYIAKTTNPNQWPLWTEIENKPSEFPPSAHSHNLDEITETEEKKIMTAEERTKLEGIEPGANKYIHPETHPASMIIETSSKRFVSDAEKASWNAKETPSGAQAKADTAEANAKSYTDIHDQNTTKHITATERTNWNDANAKKHTHSNKSILDTITQTLINTWNSAVDHISDAVKHITSAERARWNAKQDAIEGLPQVYSSENSDKFLLYRPSTGDYRSITKEDLLSGLGGTDEYIFRVKRQEFTATEGQTVFTINGQYLPNNNRISVYVWGNRQPNTAYEETNSNTITLIDGLPAGTKVIIEWFEVVNVMDYIHAESHAIDGTDPITPEMIGAVPAVEGKGLSTEDYTTAEKNKLAGIEDGANKYVHPSTHPASMITETSSKRFVSDTEKANWNDANAKKHTHSNKSILDTITQILIDAWNGAVNHVSDPIKHITANERMAWNAKADINDIPTNVSELENDAGYVTREELDDADYGDMLKAVYDTNNDGIVDNADKLDGKHASDFALASHTHTFDAITGNLETTKLTEPPYVMGNVTITSKPLFDVLRADRTAFLPASQIIIEKSTDGGVTWEDAGISDTNKAKLFTGQRPSIAIPRKDGKKNTDCMLRITITGMKYNVPPGTAETAKYNYWNSNYVIARERYFLAEDAWLWVNANADRIYCKVERATGGNPNNWITVREAFLSGWSGGNYIKLGFNFGGGTSQTGNNWNWRFTFRTATTSNDFDNTKLNQTYITQSQVIHHIKISGRNVHNSSNNLMYHDHLYTWDENQNAIFPANVTASDFYVGSNKVWHEGNFDPSTKSNVNHNHNLADLSEKSYNSLTDKPNIPSKVSELENDAGYVTREELGNAGYGDMLKSIYDQNNNGIVDNAEKLGGKLPSYYEQVYHTGASPPTNTNLLWIDTGA